MRLFILLGIFLCLVKSPVLAQADFRPGFVVTSTGDSIRGFVEYTMSETHERECRFKPAYNAAAQIYTPTDLKSYGITGGRRFISLSLPLEGGRRQVFAQLMEGGRVQLLMHHDVFWLLKDSVLKLEPPKRVLIETSDGPKMKTENRYIGFLNIAFADCQVNTRRARYEARSLSNLVREYNSCKGQLDVTALDLRPWTRVNLDVFAGVQSSSMVLSNGGKGSSLSPTGGLGIELSSPRITDKVFFVAEAWYYQFLFQSYTEYQGSDYTDRFDVTYQSKAVKIPVGVRINLRPEEKTFYLKFGLAFTMLINPSTTMIFEREQGGIVTTNYSTDDGQGKGQSVGVWGGIGYLKKIKRMNVFGEVRADALGMTNLSIVAGLRF